MSIFKNPSKTPVLFNTLNDLINRERFFESDLFKNDWAPVPAVNMKETATSYDIEVSAPGLTKKDFDVKLEDGMLSVSVAKEETEEEKKDNYYRKEFSYRSFHRSISLPEDIQEDAVSAKYENGILQVSIARKEKPAESKAKKVTVS